MLSKYDDFCVWINGNHGEEHRKRGYSVYGTVFAYTKSRHPHATYERLSASTHRLIREFLADNLLKIEDGRIV